jgi:hypothetical protein
LKLKADFDLVDLPVAIDYILGLDETVKKVMSGGKHLSKATLCALGLIYIPGKSEPYLTLKWSPLLRGARRAKTFKFDEMVEAVVDYLAGQINSACSLIQERALLPWNNLLELENCHSCVTQGLPLPSKIKYPLLTYSVGWDRPEKVEVHGSKCSHISISRDQFRKSMQVSTDPTPTGNSK